MPCRLQLVDAPSQSVADSRGHVDRQHSAEDRGPLLRSLRRDQGPPAEAARIQQHSQESAPGCSSGPHRKKRGTCAESTMHCRLVGHPDPMLPKFTSSLLLRGLALGRASFGIRVLDAAPSRAQAFQFREDVAVSHRRTGGRTASTRHGFRPSMS